MKLSDKGARHLTILIQLAQDYLGFLELFEDEDTVKRANQVRNILERMELTYDVPETSAQPQNAQEKREGRIYKTDYWRDN